VQFCVSFELRKGEFGAKSKDGGSRISLYVANICFNEELNLYVAKNKRRVQMKDGKKKNRVFYLIQKENEIRPIDIPGGKVASGFYQDAWDNNQSTNRSIQRKKKRKISMVSPAPEQAIPTVSPAPKCTSHQSEPSTP